MSRQAQARPGDNAQSAIHCPLRIGLTGGIGSGKSTVANYFAEHGITVLDADVIARELTEPGRPALGQIIDTFGREILDSAGRLDRRAIRELVFPDRARRRALEQILHPRVREALRERCSAVDEPYVVLVIPLLVEADFTREVDRILVVDAPEWLQRNRVGSRDGMTKETLDAIIASQASRQARLSVADDVITNDGDRSALREQVAVLHERYLALAEG